MTNGPVNPDAIEIHTEEPVISDTAQDIPELADDEDKHDKSTTRSTDLIFLKSVVMSNTLERPKKVSELNIFYAQRYLREGNLISFDKC